MNGKRASLIYANYITCIPFNGSSGDLLKR